MNDFSILEMTQSIVPISRFNKGEANRIFKEVEADGTKIVMKNNRPACILMSPEKYESLMELLSDQLLEEEAEERMAHYDAGESLSREEMMKELGISEDDLAKTDVEIE